MCVGAGPLPWPGGQRDAEECTDLAKAASSIEIGAVHERQGRGARAFTAESTDSRRDS